MATASLTSEMTACLSACVNAACGVGWAGWPPALIAAMDLVEAPTHTLYSTPSKFMRMEVSFLMTLRLPNGRT